MKAKLFFVAVLLQLLCASSFAQWQPISPDTISNFSAVFFTTDKKGFVTSCDPVQSSWSTNGLRMTTDGGVTWTWGPGSELCPPAIFFTDSTVGYFFTQGSAVGAQAVKKTTDGGVTWNNVHNGLPGENVFFVNEHIGYATGANTMAKTIDGGVTWTWQSLGGPSVLDALHYVNKDTGYIGGWYNPVIAKTTDGTTWTMLSSDYGIHALHFLSPQVGYAAGEDVSGNNPVIIKTTDGGASWTVKYRLSVAMPFYFTAIQAVSSNICYAAGAHGTILVTTDGGDTWTPQVTGTTKKINALHCPTSHSCYAAGDSIVLKLTIAETTVSPLTKKVSATFSPNPMADRLIVTIEGYVHPDATLQLLDPLGREAATYHVTETQTLINASNLTPGVYIYRIGNIDGWLQTGRVIVAR